MFRKWPLGVFCKLSCFIIFLKGKKKKKEKAGILVPGNSPHCPQSEDTEAVSHERDLAGET